MSYFRVYSNGDRVSETEEMHQESLSLRPGCALFVDGRCIQKGYLDDARIAAIEAEIIPK